MNKCERVLNALKRIPTDYLPYQIEFDEEGKKRMGAYLQDPHFEKKWGAQHIACCMYSGRPVALPDTPGFFRDDYGVVWDRTGEDKTLGIMRELLIPDITQNRYKIPALNKMRLRNEYKVFFDTLGDRFPIAGLGLAVYERAWSLHGKSNLLASMNTCPAKVSALFEQILQNALEIVDVMAEFNFKAIFVGDDWTEEDMIEMGASNWRVFIKPVLQGIYSRAHSKGLMAFQHSCGNIEELFPDLIEIGLDCYQTLQPEAYDIAYIKREYGNGLAFWGGLGAKGLLPSFTAAQARDHAINTLRIFGKDGGYIAAPSHMISGNIDPEVVLAVKDVFINQDRYLYEG